MREVVVDSWGPGFRDGEIRIHVTPFSVTTSEVKWQEKARRLVERTELPKENESTRRANVLFMLRELMAWNNWKPRASDRR